LVAAAVADEDGVGTEVGVAGASVGPGRAGLDLVAVVLGGVRDGEPAGEPEGGCDLTGEAGAVTDGRAAEPLSLVLQPTMSVSAVTTAAERIVGRNRPPGMPTLVSRKRSTSVVRGGCRGVT
jgi:hypothetical protein